MKQFEAVIKTMEHNGGFATLGYLYQHVLNEPGAEWKTKTPFATIRRIVQDSRFFFKLKPGLWALNSHRDRLPADLIPSGGRLSRNTPSDHAYYQGLILEIGNLKRFGTYLPSQDKNKSYLDKRLGDLATVKEIHKFGYDKIVRRASTIDVVWFNERKMPASCFEVEHTTEMTNSMLKFVELQDFNARCYIVADQRRRAEFYSKIAYTAFSPLSTRVAFMSYGDLSDWHAKSCELDVVEKRLAFQTPSFP